MTPSFPPRTVCELEGWNPVWFRLRPTGRGTAELAGLRDSAAREVRTAYPGGVPSTHPTVAAVRRLFRSAGTDPTRYRPSSEALLRRLVKGDPLPAIHPLVDLNNLLSVRLLVPCCVIDAARATPPFNLRAGRAGELMLSMRGEFNLEGKPLLEDADGPFGTPITDAERVKLTAAAGEVWLVAYLPGNVAMEYALETLNDLLAAAPVAELAGHS